MSVVDRENPTGMFSKAGRFSIEMFSLLQEKDSIMSGHRTSERSSITDPDRFKHKKNPTVQIKNSRHDTETKETKKSIKEVRLHQPFTKTVSRDYLEQIVNRAKTNNQKFGMYNPKYHFIYEKSPFYQDQDYLEEQREQHLKKFGLSPTFQKSKIKQSQNASIVKSIPSTDIVQTQRSVQQYQQTETDYFIKQRSPKGAIDFKKMRERIPMASTVDPHEKRFEYLSIPNISSKVQVKPANIYFKEGKKDVGFLNAKLSGLQYDVKYDCVLPRTDKQVIQFEKVLPRRFPYKPIYTLDESIPDTSMYRPLDSGTHVNTDPNKSSFLKKIPGSVNFSKFIPREQDS